MSRTRKQRGMKPNHVPGPLPFPFEDPAVLEAFLRVATAEWNHVASLERQHRARQKIINSLPKTNAHP